METTTMLCRTVLTTLAQSEASGSGGGWMANGAQNPFGTLSATLQRNLDVLARPESLSPLLEQINIVWSLIFIIVGGLCVLHGYRWHKWMMVVLAGMAGVWVGTVLGDRVGNEAIAAACLAVLFAVLAWPLMRYAVALFGGLAGAFAGANAWTIMGQDPTQHWVGGAIGLIIVGMMAFMTFRFVVIALTTIGGASLLGFGGAAALLQVDGWRGAILRTLEQNPLIFPVLVASAALLGVVWQLGGGIKGMNECANNADARRAKAAQAKAAA